MSTSTKDTADLTLPPGYQQEIERNYRFNFLYNALDGACYWFGYSFISPTIILPLFLSHFTDNPLIIGLIPTINTAFFLLPQLFTSNFIERSPRKKIFPVNLGFFSERLPVMLFAPIALFFARTNPTLAMVLFLAAYTWYSLGAGLIIVGWQDMIAKIIPFDRRGRFFGITNFVGNLTGILGALTVPFVLERFIFPTGYVMAFTMAAILIFLSWVFLSRVREPPLPSNKPHISQWEYLRSMPAVVRKDPNFLRYLVYQILNALSGMASGFLIIYSSRRFNLSDAQAGMVVIAMQIGQAVTVLLLGLLADKKGHKLSLEISTLCNILSFGLAFLAPNPIWFYPIFFLRGAVFAGTFVSGIAIVMEFCPPTDRPTYFGLANTIPGVFSTVAPLIGGWIAAGPGYLTLFAISAVFGAASYGILRWSVREPRHVIQSVNATSNAL